MGNVKSHLVTHSTQLPVESGGRANNLTAQDPNIEESSVCLYQSDKAMK